MWDPQRLTTLWASTACYRNSFIFIWKKPALVLIANTLKKFDLFAAVAGSNVCTGDRFTFASVKNMPFCFVESF
jgi:predicted benzoate:H+ symporter BenE